MLGEPPSIVALRATLYLPKAATKSPAPGAPSGPRCAANAMAEEMARLFATASWQRRANPVCDRRLSAAAQDHAEEMLRLRYFSHVSPSGLWPNARVRSFGYELPEWYADDANNVESIGLNFYTADTMLAAWLSAPSHQPHISGSHPYFAAQRCFGVGYARGPEDAGVYWVLLSAPCPVGR